MGMFAEFSEALAAQVAQSLDLEGQQRVSALICARSVMPEADVYDRIQLARYIITGSENVEVRVAEEQIRLEKRTQTEDYPFESGDALVLGPGIFASTQQPSRETVICWEGENFVSQRNDVVGPDPEFDPEHEPAPSAGLGWVGRRGRQS